MEPATLLLTVLTAGICLYYFVLNKLSHFKRLKIPHVRPIPFLGNLAPYVFQREAHVELLCRIYNLFPKAKYVGFYNLTKPVYFIRDPELITAITIRNFDNFCDHQNFVSDSEPMARKNLFGLRGDHWREMRKLLSPAFTSSKMKMMFGLMCECADNFSNFLVTQSGKIAKTYEMKELLSRYTNDVVATCAFGISIDSFKNPNNEFYLLGKKTFTFDGRLSLMFFIHAHFPLLTRLFKVRMFSKRVEKFFKNIVNSTVKMRDEQGIFRPDMIQLMMKSRNKDQGPKFDIEEMTAQAFIFFFGGFDTVSTAMCFLVHEIAINPDIQDRLREEIDHVLKKTNGKPTYEAVIDMKYLDAVVTESLRLYPIISYIDRLCVKEFELPPATSDGEPIILKPGDSIWFSSYALQHDPKYYPQPNKFNPDRFLNSNIDNSVYIPFGLGPRICIGNRFALLQMKIMLFYLLWRCDLEPDAKTKNPIILNKKSLVTIAEGGVWLKLRTRKSEDPVAQCLSNGVE
ncbi:cytochrome P450 9e2-like [Anoplolepis gracilipes]|uniref:cytochrome P450 9e2-like n=1 Tax=Anoplolepis gracilipes TaxID=354296 RepID=UPI003BA11ADE